MGLGIMPTAWSYELFWEFLDMQKGAGCNSVIKQKESGKMSLGKQLGVKLSRAS